MSCPANLKITRQLPLTVIEWNPLRSPVRECRRHPGAARSLGLVAASSAVSCSLSFDACCGCIPALVPRLKNAPNPLCLKLLITPHRKPTSDALQPCSAVRPPFGCDGRNPLTRMGHWPGAPGIRSDGLGMGSVGPGETRARSSACSHRTGLSVVLKIRVWMVRFRPWPPLPTGPFRTHG
jgi:hypothetical protein